MRGEGERQEQRQSEEGGSRKQEVGRGEGQREKIEGGRAGGRGLKDVERVGDAERRGTERVLSATCGMKSSNSAALSRMSRNLAEQSWNRYVRRRRSV